VQTEALGLSAEDVEQLITVPLEADLLNGVEGIDVIRSESLPGLSSVVMVFESGTDVLPRPAAHRRTPRPGSRPTQRVETADTAAAVVIGQSRPDDRYVNDRADTDRAVGDRPLDRAPRLMGVPGVANVSIWGLRDQQLQVQVDPNTLRDRKVTLNQVNQHSR
jgi:multidrug efflux pump subunit AcrB